MLHNGNGDQTFLPVHHRSHADLDDDNDDDDDDDDDDDNDD